MKEILIVAGSIITFNFIFPILESICGYIQSIFTVKVGKMQADLDSYQAENSKKDVVVRGFGMDDEIEEEEYDG